MSVCSAFFFFISFVWCAIFCSVKSLQGMGFEYCIYIYYTNAIAIFWVYSPLEICKFYHAIDLHSYFIGRWWGLSDDMSVVWHGMFNLMLNSGSLIQNLFRFKTNADDRTILLKCVPSIFEIWESANHADHKIDGLSNFNSLYDGTSNTIHKYIKR